VLAGCSAAWAPGRGYRALAATACFARQPESLNFFFTDIKSLLAMTMIAVVEVDQVAIDFRRSNICFFRGTVIVL
jgi:hypothetical protein